MSLSIGVSVDKCVPLSARQLIISRYLVIVLLVLVLFNTNTVQAATLQLSPHASPWLHFLAAGLLYLHIGGGAIGLLAGLVASVARKGAALHRAAGKCFFVAMFVAYAIGAIVAPFLSVGQRPNFVAGILALYLLVSGVMAARRRGFIAGHWEKIGLCVALLITATGLLFAYQGANSVTGTVDGSPPQAFIIFIVAGAIAAVEEIVVLVRGKLSEVGRKSRHLWRMCFSFFIASGSLFYGQPQIFPDGFNGSALQGILASVPLLVMLLGLIAVRMPSYTARL